MAVKFAESSTRAKASKCNIKDNYLGINVMNTIKFHSTHCKGPL